MSIPHIHCYPARPALAAALILCLCCSQENAIAATINVTTNTQGITTNLCSLQEAIYASTFQTNQAISSTNPDVFYATGCTPGTGDDVIVLVAGEHYDFDDFWRQDGHNIFGPTATPIIVSKIIIQGNGATLQSFDRYRPNNSRLFAIGKVSDPNFPSSTGDLTLRNVYIKGFHTNGGDGASGGGGGLGAGGAIYNAGLLSIENSTFEQNGAVGGRGSGGNGGGGGGLFGRGGSGCPYSAGGGGGSTGDGGNGTVSACLAPGGGGGGGGTVSSGRDGESIAVGGNGGAGGFGCGGKGGNAGIESGHHGSEATCPGGGGGGAGGNQSELCDIFSSCYAEGGVGNFGGGGGGGIGDGGRGGFGGGGGAGYTSWFRVSGGSGGFGGGGGAAGDGTALTQEPGAGGLYGGRADDTHGGGGGALGGAIFSTGTMVVRNSTFFNNFVSRGDGGGGSADNGADAGGAIFAMGLSVDVNDSTFSGNQSTGSGGAIVVYGVGGRGRKRVNFVLNNTIIGNNGANECFFWGNVKANGVANLIMQNGSGIGPFRKCPGVVTSSDPQLQALQFNSPGNTPTMAIGPTSPAVGQADPPPSSLATDQRGVLRTLGARADIGAFELTAGRCPEATAFLTRANAIVGIDATHTTAYSNLICGLVEDGTYSKLDALYVLATQSDGSSPGDRLAKLNLVKDSFDLVGHGMYAFAPDKGIACDGTTAYFDTQFNPSTSGGQFSRDNASLGVYVRTNTTANGSEFGAFDGSTETALYLNYYGGFYFRINSTFDHQLAAGTNAQGFWIGTRTGANAMSVYRNGAEIASSTTPSNGVPNLSMYVCASNRNGGSLFEPDEVAAFFIGGALNKTQTAGMSVRINQFLLTFGTNVY